jgi:hypothetical protein
MFFDGTNGCRIIPLPPPAALLARVVAEGPKHAGEGKGLENGRNRLLDPTILGLAKHHRDVQPERAKPVAGGEAVTDMIAKEQL